MWSSSTFAVPLRLAHIDRQPDGWALFPRNHRPVAFVTPPPRPCLGAETPAQQEKDDGERNAADEPKYWVSHVQHSQSSNRCCADSCTFNTDGKGGATSLDCTNLLVVLQTLCKRGLNCTDDFNGGAGI
jgi:hypothetical protein